MSTIDVERLRQIKTLPSLIKFLRDELDWPVEADGVDELTFEYTPGELGLDARYERAVKEIRQIRRLDSNQPWGMFWVSFDKKRIPVVVLRRILGNLIIKKRASSLKADRRSWDLHDLLFISSYGEEEHRTITFAHFTEDPNTHELPVLRVLGWDDQNSIMQLDRVANSMHSHFRWPGDSEDVAAWRKRWSDAFTDRYREAVRSADELIPRLAALASAIRRRVRDVLEAETEHGPMRRLFAGVQGLLIHDMNEDGFADMYAQTVAYGLLSASFSRPADITPQNLVQLTAISNPFLENLLDSLFRLNRGKFHFDVDEVGINDVLDLLRNTNVEAIKAAFSDKNPAEDPVVRFYEGFLKQYDPEQRIHRGVFFTPRPVVSYIVRSVHESLRTEFGLEDGLASTDTWADMKTRFPDLTIPSGTRPTDSFVCILDPAVGTGTFLFETIEVIERTMKDKWCRELGKKTWHEPEIIKLWREYVAKHLLPRIYGYEFMMAPYAIAHLKLALKLAETGHVFRQGTRLHIYLTNSLEPPAEMVDPKLGDMFTLLAGEARQVNDIKRNRAFTVIIGNPPYANYSANLSPELRRIVDKYRTFHGMPIRERNQLQFERNLQDDYVKFIAVGEDLVLASGAGVLSYITNGTMLASSSLRGMREHVYATFTEMAELHLHGGTNESAINVTEDQNVFDIGQAVAVHVYRRTPLPRNKSNHVDYSDLFGSREQKYDALGSLSVLSTKWESITPDTENFSFVPQDVGASRSLMRIDSAFVQFGAGVKTNRDETAIAFDRGSLIEKVRTFNRRLVADSVCQLAIQPILYRPFDVRHIFYHHAVVKSRSLPTMKHILGHENIGLLACTTWTTPECFSVNVSRRIVEMKTGTHDRGTTFFPLYRYENVLGQSHERVHNLSSGFVAEWIKSTGTQFLSGGRGDLSTSSGPDDVFLWLYGLFHSSQYRSCYRAALSQGFPIVLFSKNKDLLREITRLGDELVALHLLESSTLEKALTRWKGPTPSSEVEKVSYTDGTVWIDKAKTEGFRGVPEEVWQFHMGGYQVCEKWLKDRKGRQLSKDDIAHYQKIVVALAETIKIMAQIDATIEAHGGWPIR